MEYICNMFFTLAAVYTMTANTEEYNSSMLSSTNERIDIVDITESPTLTRNKFVELEMNYYLKAKSRFDNQTEGGLCSDRCDCQRTIDETWGQALDLTCYVAPAYGYMKTIMDANLDVHALSIVNSNLTVVPDYLCEMADLGLRYLQLSDNRIEHVLDHNLTCFSKLKLLNLEHNLLETLYDYMLDGLDELHCIFLAHNRLTVIGRETFTRPHLKLLQIINLQNNMLKVIDLWMFQMPSFLNNFTLLIDISLNNISDFTNSYDFHSSEIKSGQSVSIDLSSNQIRSLKIMEELMGGIEDKMTLLHTAYAVQYNLGKNPFDCDCRMFEIIQDLRLGKKFLDQFGSLDLFNFHCRTPIEARGKLIFELPDNVFRCYVTDSCPPSAHCIHTPGNNTMTVVNRQEEINSLPEVVPYETHIQLIYPNTNIASLSYRPYLRNVTTLQLAYSQLSSITPAAIQQLYNAKVINFRECHLTTLPKEINNVNFSQLEAIDLVGNPFVCDCHMPSLQTWLTKQHHAVVDMDVLLCHNIPFQGREILSINSMLMICGYPYIFGTTSLFLLVCLILSGILLLRLWKRRIMLRLVKFFDKNFTLRFNPGPRTLSNHVCIFVAMEDQLSPRVNQLCDVIERKGHDWKIHRVGYQLGPPKLDIAQHMPESEGCVFFLSHASVQCYYSIFCFRLAVDLFIQHYHSMFLIPVLLESKHSLIQNSSTTKDTKLFLELFDYVDVSSDQNLQQVFWDMRKIMRKQVKGFPHQLTPSSNSSGLNTSLTIAALSDGDGSAASMSSFPTFFDMPSSRLQEVSTNNLVKYTKQDETINVNPRELILPYIDSDSE